MRNEHMNKDIFLKEISKVRGGVNFEQVARTIGKSTRTVMLYLRGDRGKVSTMIEILDACKDQVNAQYKKYAEMRKSIMQ